MKLTLKQRETLISLLPTVLLLAATAVFILLFLSPLLGAVHELFWNFSLLLLNTVGLSFVVIGGGFDFSLGGQSALSIVTILLLRSAGLPDSAAILCGVGVCLLCGIVNAVFNCIPYIPSTFVTISTLFIFYGLAFLLYPDIGELPDSPICAALGGKLGFIPYHLIIAVLGLGVLQVLLYASFFGKHLKVLSSNSEALRAVGVSPHTVRILSFLIASLFFAIQSVLRLAHTADFSPETVIGTECLVLCSTLVSNGIVLPLRVIRKLRISRLTAVLISVAAVSVWYTAAEMIQRAPLRIILLGVMLLVGILMDRRGRMSHLVHENIRASGITLTH